MFSSAAAYGVDEKAQEMLSKLPEVTQQVVMQKLQEGLAAGKVKNASAYVVGICNGPDVLGVDEKAAKLLDELPKHMRVQVLDKLRRATDVRNPSAWVAKAVLQAKQNGAIPFGGGAPAHFQGGYGLRGDVAYGMQFGIDPPARQLLMSLPPPTQQEIIAKLMQQANVRNPSAWIAKAAMQAGATSNLQGAQVGNQVTGLDPQAMALLASLPEAAQHEIQTKLMNSLKTGNVMNPSAWVAKACLKSGATSIPGAGKGARRTP
eukprot:TRINITY_DN4003_c0_g2_i1.p1 TRINITY_DN4003_c0_g2~~TRINITY_DN4003_c0_g2_i1.p1  ORF type:complete len:262 (+),score=65.99 TRINITY_DN4003_c0_g2_i1:90-875(+)